MADCLSLYSACINSCGFYKQLTWLLSNSPLHPPPPASIPLYVSLSLSLRLISSFTLCTGRPRLDLKIRYAKWKQKGDILFLHRPRVKAKKHRFLSRRALAEVAAFIIAHDRRAAGLHTEEAARSSSDVKQLFTRGVFEAYPVCIITPFSHTWFKTELSISSLDSFSCLLETSEQKKAESRPEEFRGILNKLKAPRRLVFLILKRNFSRQMFILANA